MGSIVERLFRVKISSKGQIAIPKPLREALHFHNGDTILLTPTEEGILMRHPPTEGRGLRGLLKGLNVDIAECEAILEEAKRSLSKVRG